MFKIKIFLFTEEVQLVDMRRRRKRKPPSTFVPTEKLRNQVYTTSKKKSKRRVDKSAKEKRSEPAQNKKINTFFLPRAREKTLSPVRKKTKVVKETLQRKRRLRSTAPIYKLIDEICSNHPGCFKEVNSINYVCKCGKSFQTSSYKRENFEKHLK